MMKINCCQFIDTTVEGTVSYDTSVIRFKQGDNAIVIPMSLKEKII